MNEQLFQNRRKALMDRLDDGSFAVLYAGEAPHKTNDQFFPFVVDRNFHYLTGLNRSAFVLVLIKSGVKRFEYLFIEEPSDYATKWLGRRMTKEEALDVSGIPLTNIFFVEQFAGFITSQVMGNSRKALVKAPSNLYLDLYRYLPYVKPKALVKAEKIIETYPELTLKNIDEILDLQRMIKDEVEVKAIETAIGYAQKGLEAIWKSAKPGVNEHELEALFEYASKAAGSEGNSFSTIAASGKNATVLHYEDNNQVAKKGSLVLLDLGCLSGHYASDISRTWPVSGTFSERQKVLYQLVLDVNKQCIDLVKPGLMVAELNAYAKKLLAEGAIKIGLIKEASEIEKYYYHNVSHYLGLDVHDVGSYQLPLAAGVVLTIEPGLYVEEEAIGIRIEDNVLVTETGHRNLSKGIIKEIADLEAFMKK